MEIFQSIVLGIVQGLGEFLPISSTAHLILIPYFFGWKDPGLNFDVALHAGTLIAVLAYFYTDWVNIFKLAFSARYKIQDTRYNKKLLFFIIIATIPGVLAGYFLEEKAETIFRHPLVIVFTLSVVGLLLYIADKRAKRIKNLENISCNNALIIGIAQALAIIPGVSRSGATITAGLFCGLDRISAARFSFLLSTPIIFGATVFKLPNLFENEITVSVVIGIIVSAVSGYLAIKYLLKFVEQSGYVIFFWYRLGLAVLIGVVYFLR